MKLSKLPIVLTVATLIAIITVSLVHAQGGPLLLGGYYQPVPFEALPTADAIVSVTAASRALAYDGDLLSSGNVYPTGTGTTSASWTFTTYTTPDAGSQFPIGWVDIKIKYNFPTATTDDTYQFRFSIDGGVTWTAITNPVSAVKFNSDGVAQLRAWTVSRPGGGPWSWADIGGLQVQVLWARGGSAWDGTTRKMYIFEAAADVYGQTLPASGTTISVQPSKVPAKTTLDGSTDYCFVDIVVTQVTSLAGWQFIIDFDTNVLTPVDYFVTYPFTDIGASDLNDAGGYVSLAMSIPTTDPLVSTGVTGAQFTIARVFFQIDASADPSIPNGTFSLFTFRSEPSTKLVAVDSSLIPYTAHNGQYGEGAVPEFPLGIGLVMLLAPLAPIAYIWRTRRKVIKK